MPDLKGGHGLKSDRRGEDTGHLLHKVRQHGGRKHDARQHDGGQKKDHGGHGLFGLRPNGQPQNAADSQGDAEQQDKRTKIQRFELKPNHFIILFL